MAAFCTCCGSAITLQSMGCPVCGAPSHGMKAREIEKAENTSFPGEQSREKLTELVEGGSDGRSDGRLALEDAVTGE